MTQLLKRPRINFYALLLFISSLILSKQVLAYGLGLDHAPLDSRHSQVAEKFINTHLKVDGLYSLDKLREFKDRLETEKRSLIDDVYETTLIEELEIKLSEIEDAKKDALKEIREDKNDYLIAYNDYLLKKIDNLIVALERGEDETVLDGLVDDFIRGYVAFYLPNAFRTAEDHDVNISTLVKRAFKPYVFRRNNEKKIAANNLVVEDWNAGEIGRCLQKSPAIGSYLTNADIEGLKSCQFDISRLNPGVSALWKQITGAEMARIKEGDKELYPPQDAKLLFKKVRLGGKGSPKIDVEYKVNGEKYKIKLKMGDEVHSEIMVSLLARMVGFNQDKMQYRRQVKVYLGDTSFHSFKSQFAMKYGNENVIRYIDAHGGERGNEWIILKDVLFEAKQSEELRIGGLDLNSWDFANRREYRAFLLWLGYLNIMDTKPGNFKVIFRETENGLVPLHRLQDVGFSLGAILTLKGPQGSGLLNFIDKYNINTFSTKFMTEHSDGESLSLWWNDFANTHKRFQTTTYEDLKWLARKIAVLTDEDFYYAIRQSGVPEDIIELFRHKLVLRRNNIVKAFGLEDEYPLLEAPDLSQYSPNSSVKNGKVVAKHFEGQHDHFQAPKTGLMSLVNFVDYNIPFDLINNKFTDAVAAAFGGSAGINSLGANLGIDVTPASPTLIPVDSITIRPGVAVYVQRRVGLNDSMMNAEGKRNAYFIQDTLVFEIDARAKILTTLASFIPTEIRAGLRVYRKEFQFVHFAETPKEAYLAPFKLLKLVPKLKASLVYDLKPQEVVKVSDAYGFEVDAGVEVFTNIPLLNNGISVALGWRKVSPVYFTRDQYGYLHVYKEKTQEIYGGFHFELANANLLVASLPLIGIEFTHRAYFHEAMDYSFKLPQSDEVFEHRSDVSKIRQFEREHEAFSKLWTVNGTNEVSSLIRRNFYLKAKGFIQKLNHAYLFFFRKKLERGSSKVEIDLPDGTNRRFYRYFLTKSDNLGMDNITIPVEGPNRTDAMDRLNVNNFVMPKGKSQEVIVELDKNDPTQFVGMIRVGQYYRHRTRGQLMKFIDELNEDFSVDENLPFYRDYVLPAREEINSYRKLYAYTRVFVNGHGVMEKIRNTSLADFEKQAYKALGEAMLTRRGLVGLHQRNERYFALKALMSTVKRLKRVAHKVSSFPQTVTKEFANLLHRFKADELGVQVLLPLFGTENVFVMGEIYGVLNSFSHIPSASPNAGRRFAGKSYGTYKIVPPIQHYLRYNRYLPPSIFISNEFEDDIFGEVPRGMSFTL